MAKKAEENPVKEKNTHADHRKRMRERFRECGPKSFRDHELLEMLLYHVNSRGNTNPQAHVLLDEFGSLKGVFSAPYESLLTVKGVGESSAFLIKLFYELFVRCLQDERKHQKTDQILCGEDAIRYFQRKFKGETKEIIMLACLDNQGRVIHYAEFPPGQVNFSSLDVREIISKAIGVNAAAIVLAHNHPNGSEMPSDADISATRSLITVLHSMKITLFDHVIIGENRRWYSMRDSRVLGLFGSRR